MKGSTNHDRSRVGATDVSGFTRTAGSASLPVTLVVDPEHALALGADQETADQRHFAEGRVQAVRRDDVAAQVARAGLAVDHAVGGETDGADGAHVVHREASRLPAKGHARLAHRQALALHERRDPAQRADAEHLGEHRSAHDFEIVQHQLAFQKLPRAARVGAGVERERAADDLLHPNERVQQPSRLIRRDRDPPRAVERRPEVAARGQRAAELERAEAFADTLHDAAQVSDLEIG